MYVQTNMGMQNKQILLQYPNQPYNTRVQVVNNYNGAPNMYNGSPYMTDRPMVQYTTQPIPAQNTVVIVEQNNAAVAATMCCQACICLECCCAIICCCLMD